MRPESSLLHIDNLTFSHGPEPLFQDFSARLPAGVSLLCGGENRGKTTLLRLLAGQLRPHAGQITLGRLNPRIEPEAWQAEVCWLDPKADRHDQKLPADCFAEVRQRHPAFSAARLEQLIQGLGLEPHLGKALYMLSTGTRRKVWLAAALAAGARLTLLDEPFAALDHSSINCLLALLSEAAEQADRAWVIADYSAPTGLRLACTLDLGD